MSTPLTISTLPPGGLPALLAFLYIELLLAYAPTVHRLMDGRWVKPTIITLSILSFIDVMFGLTRKRHGIDCHPAAHAALWRWPWREEASRRGAPEGVL